MMIVQIDTKNKQFLYNGKVFHIDPFAALAAAQAGYKIEVIEVDEDAIVTVQLTMKEHERRT
jgi:hypothetical protein